MFSYYSESAFDLPVQILGGSEPMDCASIPTGEMQPQRPQIWARLSSLPASFGAFFRHEAVLALHISDQPLSPTPGPPCCFFLHVPCHHVIYCIALHLVLLLPLRCKLRMAEGSVCLVHCILSTQSGTWRVEVGRSLVSE